MSGSQAHWLDEGLERACRELEGMSLPTEDGTHVYAVGETEKGFTANALALDTLTAGLTLLNSQSTGGASPCYITVSPDGKFVLTANYMGANITVFPRLADGKFGEGHVLSFQGKGADKERQEQPHLHCVYLDRKSVV